MKKISIVLAAVWLITPAGCRKNAVIPTLTVHDLDSMRVHY